MAATWDHFHIVWMLSENVRLALPRVWGEILSLFFLMFSLEILNKAMSPKWHCSKKFVFQGLGPLLLFKLETVGDASMFFLFSSLHFSHGKKEKKFSKNRKCLDILLLVLKVLLFTVFTGVYPCWNHNQHVEHFV